MNKTISLIATIALLFTATIQECNNDNAQNDNYPTAEENHYPAAEENHYPTANEGNNSYNNENSFYPDRRLLQGNPADNSQATTCGEIATKCLNSSKNKQICLTKRNSCLRCVEMCRKTCDRRFTLCGGNFSHKLNAYCNSENVKCKGRCDKNCA